MERPFDTSGKPTPEVQSLWAEVTDSGPETTALDGDLKADVAVVGGGLLGLATALHLRNAGADVAVLEGAEVGWGASGRNNGQVIAGLKRDPEEVFRLLDREAAERLLHFSGTAPDEVFSIIERYGIACQARRKGWLQAAHSSAALRQIENRARFWRDRTAGIEILSAEQAAARLGTAWYRGAWYDPRGGALNPLAYSRGLAAATLGLGAQVFTRTPVTALGRAGGAWRLATPRGSVAADMVVLCTNAYTGPLHRRLFRSLVPLRTAQVASAPLGPGRAEAILPGGEAASDTRRLLTSFRITPDQRLIMGGAGATGGDHHEGLATALRDAAARLFPDLGPIPWTLGWSGFLAITRDHLPRIHELGPGLFAPIGCNGRGIALTTAMGPVVADLLHGTEARDLPVPVGNARPFLLHGRRELGIALRVAWSRFGDSRDRRRAM